jgi:large subunit ribosomal protein L25
MAMLTLTGEKRDTKTDLGKLRQTGKIPAVFYGPKEPSTPIILSAIDFTKVWKKAGESSVILLNVAGEEHEALIHEVDVHPVTDVVRHADFYVIEKGKKVKVHVPITFTGTAPAVKDLGGILVKVLRELEVEAGAKDLPHDITVDIAPLKEMSSTISAGDIKLPSGVTLVTGPEEIIASVALAVEEVEEAPTAVDMSAIEVEKKGKEAKPGEEGADAAAAPAKDAAKK